MKNLVQYSVQNQYNQTELMTSWKGIPALDADIQQVLAWTNGQPALTRRIQQLVAEQEETGDLEKGTALVNKVVQRHFKADLFKSEDPKDSEVLELLTQIRDALTQGSSSFLMLNQYKEILISAKKMFYSGTLEQNQLLKIGLITADADGKLVLSNPIYKKIFNLAWTETQWERQLNQRRIDKYHLALITGLLSLLMFALFQGFMRYAPYARLLQCNGNANFKAAIDANISLDEAKIDQAVKQLKEMQRQQTFSPSCEAIFHDLLYSQAIYLRAGINNNPLVAAQVLCEIPERYYAERNIQPWFTRWSSLYRKTSFSAELKDYVSRNPCPALSLLSR